MDFGIIQKLAKCIVRPPKSQYDIENLVPPCFQLRNRIYQRHQFSVLNNRSMKIHSTLIKDRYSPSARDTIIYLHANGSSRIAMKNYIDTFLPIYDLVSFDFAGCGHSQGQYISLGYNEREDVYAIINCLKTQFKVKNIILWGRSMGAATALLYAAKYGGLTAIVSDNSYCDLEVLINQLSDDYLPFLPTFLVDSIITSIQQYIQSAMWKKEVTDFHIRKLKPINVVQKITCPVYYIGSVEDTFVNVNHTKALYNKTKSLKHLELVKGNHNQMRTKQLKEKVLKFFRQIENNPNSNPKRFNIFKGQMSSSAQKKQSETFSEDTGSEVDLINCAELQSQAKKYLAKKQLTFQKQLSYQSKSNSQSANRSNRETLMTRTNVPAKVTERSRSKIKRKKIFEGIDFINEHFNGQQL